VTSARSGLFVCVGHAIGLLRLANWHTDGLLARETNGYLFMSICNMSPRLVRRLTNISWQWIRAHIVCNKTTHSLADQHLLPQTNVTTTTPICWYADQPVFWCVCLFPALEQVGWFFWLVPLKADRDQIFLFTLFMTSDVSK